MPELLKNIVRTFLPSTCYVCDKLSDNAVCKDCMEKFNTVYKNEKRLFIKNPQVMIQAPFVYKGIVKEMIEDIKYRGIFFPVPFFASYLASMIRENAYDFLVPVPLHFLKRWKRGFNQSEEIAKEVSKLTKIPILKKVKRIRNTKSQTKLSRKERMLNVKGAFRVDISLKGKRLAIIDDVITTGATTLELAIMLYKKDAEKVDIYAASMAEMD